MERRPVGLIQLTMAAGIVILICLLTGCGSRQGQTGSAQALLQQSLQQLEHESSAAGNMQFTAEVSTAESTISICLDMEFEEEEQESFISHRKGKLRTFFDGMETEDSLELYLQESEDGVLLMTAMNGQWYQEKLAGSADDFRIAGIMKLFRNMQDPTAAAAKADGGENDGRIRLVGYLTAAELEKAAEYLDPFGLGIGDLFPGKLPDAYEKAGIFPALLMIGKEESLPGSFVIDAAAPSDRGGLTDDGIRIRTLKMQVEISSYDLKEPIRLPDALSKELSPNGENPDNSDKAEKYP